MASSWFVGTKERVALARCARVIQKEVQASLEPVIGTEEMTTGCRSPARQGQKG